MKHITLTLLITGNILSLTTGFSLAANIGKRVKPVSKPATLNTCSFAEQYPLPPSCRKLRKRTSSPPLLKRNNGSGKGKIAPSNLRSPKKLGPKNEAASVIGRAATFGTSIATENALAGNPPSEWDISGAGDPSIQGFATQMSVNRGQTISFKIDTNANNYRLDIYRMGYYGGNGARKIETIQPSVALPQNQPNCIRQNSTGLVDCGNWATSASWTVPANAISGIYFANLVRTDTGGSSHILFVVRNDTGNSDLLVQTSDSTWVAYNEYGGNSLYVGSPAGRAYKVSYNRPLDTRGNQFKVTNPFTAEYPMVRWLEANGYNVSYFSAVDSDQRGNLIRNHKAYLSVGHNEYWSKNHRANVEAARDAGVHLAFFSGNDVFWKTRWENSIDGSNQTHRTLVTYKETHANAKIDPTPAWTGTWRDPRFSPPADGGKPENALTGTIFMVNGISTTNIDVPAADGKMRFWRNTNVANLAPGQTATLAPNTLGFEWNADLDNGFRPAGLFRLSTTVRDVSSKLLRDYGSTYGNGTATHSLTLYRASSSALVFSAGSVWWSWGLDTTHDNPFNLQKVADNNIRQATVNLFADMGIQPATLQPGLVAASASTDAIKPTSTITTPAVGATVQSGKTTTLSGTATDAGTGLVGGVEVSVDGGERWHPATGRDTWSYTWTPKTPGSVTIKTRAVDDSGNLEIPGAGHTVTVGTRTCPCSIWDDGVTPSTVTVNDTKAVELGLKFRSDVNGFITGIRFYKGPQNTGTHVGTLWSSTGQQLARATFTSESASGWQQVNFGTPVAVNANTTYIVSYHTTVGRYSATNGAFAIAGVDSVPLHAPSSGASGGNGVYEYSATPAFPNMTFNATNYWVDPVFTAN